jgi:hypothetical protein
MALLMFAHMLGVALWIGGGLAGMLVAYAAREESVEIRAGAFRILTRLHTMVIGTGALIVVGTGVLLIMTMTSELSDLMRDPRLWVMILAGLAAGLMVLFVGLPTATRMGALAVASAKGEMPPAFDRYRRRLGAISSVSGALAVLALFAWYVF